MGPTATFLNPQPLKCSEASWKKPLARRRRLEAAMSENPAFTVASFDSFAIVHIPVGPFSDPMMKTLIQSLRKFCEAGGTTVFLDTGKQTSIAADQLRR